MFNHTSHIENKFSQFIFAIMLANQTIACHFKNPFHKEVKTFKIQKKEKERERESDILRKSCIYMFN